MKNKSLLKAYKLGEKAALKGKMISDNPYKNRILKRNWLEGFRKIISGN